MRLVDITFHANSEYADTTALLKAQQASLFYIDAIKDRTTVEVIKHVSAGTKIVDKKGVSFFIGENKRGYFSKQTKAYLEEIKPGVVIVHGLSFPLQILRLKMLLGRKTKIIAWHHAERPPRLLKKILHQMADLCIAKYFFTSQGNAAEWIDAGIISHQNKIMEIPPTLTVFVEQNRLLSKQNLGMSTGTHYLWVGRLSDVKDPVTVIDAFEKFIKIYPFAKLHMVYQKGELLQIIEDKIQQQLQNNIFLHGFVPNDELASWYSAADFFISSSLREAGSVTILEAMACGCIPIVSAIPSSSKVTNHGEHGLNFEPGNVDALLQTLIASTKTDQAVFSEKIKTFFNKDFSVDAVAAKLLAVCESLARK